MLAPVKERDQRLSGEEDGLKHSYPGAVDKGRMPVPGDVARCGYVKRSPTGSPGQWGTAGVCIVCERLKFG